MGSKKLISPIQMLGGVFWLPKSEGRPKDSLKRQNILGKQRNMHDGYITFLDVGRGYAVALSDDKATEAIIHKSCFDKCGQPFLRTIDTPQAVQFTIDTTLRRDARTGITHAIASEVKLA